MKRATIRPDAGCRAAGHDAKGSPWRKSIFIETGVVEFLLKGAVCFTVLFICQEGVMSRSLSSDLRGRVILVIEEGLSTREAALRFPIEIATMAYWCRRYRGQQGRSQAEPTRRARSSIRIRPSRHASRKRRR